MTPCYLASAWCAVSPCGTDCWTATMSEPTNELDRRISSAMSALHGARAAAWHSPSAHNIAVEAMCENTVNDLLDERIRAAKADEVVSA